MINLSEPTEVQELIKTKESGLYGSFTVDNEEVAVFIEQGKELKAVFYQSNGWTKESYYDVNGIKVDEIFGERWRK